MSQLSASAGFTLRCSSRSSRSSNSSESMRSDCASMPMRGSRLVGLLSIIITRVPRSGLPPQEKKAAQSVITKAMWAFLYIGGLAKNNRALCTCGGGNIRRLAVPGLVCQQGEGDSLFRFRRNAEFIRRTQAQAQRADFRGQRLHERRVLRAAAGNHELGVILAASNHEALQRISDGANGERSGGRDNISWACPGAPPQKV